MRIKTVIDLKNAMIQIKNNYFRYRWNVSSMKTFLWARTRRRCQLMV